MSQLLVALLIAVAGGAGAVARHTIDTFFPIKNKPYLATLFINTSGSFLAGLSFGLITVYLPTVLSFIITTGFLGGFTTFSASSFQLASLVQRRRFTEAGFYAVTQLIFSVIFVFLGLWIAI
ncbi:MAG TPA: CrcB family protein [Microbacteriaceae bacterium]|nr:CrcB family protein [Microbacteriaceae bacterium]